VRAQGPTVQAHFGTRQGGVQQEDSVQQRMRWAGAAGAQGRTQCTREGKVGKRGGKSQRQQQRLSCAPGCCSEHTQGLHSQVGKGTNPHSKVGEGG